MDNKTKADRIHDLLPKFLNTRANTNWKGLIDAIGQEDETLAQLIAEVREQFFIKTASRPYLDTLAANNNVSRPKLVGMVDDSFKDYIVVTSYKPKQVKLIIDLLIDLFFSKDATTAFLMSQAAQPFLLQDGWELLLKVDGINNESITFKASDFTNIASATADEIVAAYNRQSKYSYAMNYFDSVTKSNYIRIFTATIGSKGSLEIAGGRANIALRLNGFISTAGNGSNTQWTVTKVGDTVTFQHTGGASPGLSQLQVGDIFISNISGNQGSFPITNIDIVNNSIQFTNLLATPGVYGQLSANDSKFLRPDKYVVYKLSKRAVTWETAPGEVTVEMPTTPPIVRRTIKGAQHLNGVVGLMTNRDSDTSLTVANATGFPKTGGMFVIEPVEAITARILTPDLNEVVTTTNNGRLIYNTQRYTYSSRVVLSTTGTVSAGSNQITVASVAGLSIGMNIFMEGFRPDATILDIVGLVVTSSIPATVDLTGAPVEFGGNTLTGISPNLPVTSSLNEFALSSLTRTSDVITGTTSSTHNFQVGQNVAISSSSGINILSTTGDTVTNSNVLTNLASVSQVAPKQLVFGAGIPANTKVVQVLSPTSVLISQNATATATGVSILFNEDVNVSGPILSVTGTQFTFNLIGTDGTAVTPGTASVETIKLSNSNSRIIITGAQSSDDTRIRGSYVWDLSAPYVLSSSTATIQSEIKAGTIVRLLSLSPNDVPDQSGFVIFDYGKNTQEGPIKYLYKPASNIIALDPSYTFQQDHAIGAPMVVLSHKGPHVMDEVGGEYAPYVTDPSVGRVILQQLIQAVTSAGIFVNFLIRFPEQLYNLNDVYNRDDS